MRTERPHRCDLAHHLSSGVGAIGETGRDYVQEEVRPGEPGREGGLGHVRRDWFRFAQWFTNRRGGNVRPGARQGTIPTSQFLILYT